MDTIIALQQEKEDLEEELFCVNDEIEMNKEINEDNADNRRIKKHILNRIDKIEKKLLEFDF